MTLKNKMGQSPILILQGFKADETTEQILLVALVILSFVIEYNRSLRLIIINK